MLLVFKNYLSERMNEYMKEEGVLSRLIFPLYSLQKKRLCLELLANQDYPRSLFRILNVNTSSRVLEEELETKYILKY